MNLKLPEDNRFVNNMLTGWFGVRGLYLEYQTSKKTADALADNAANKVKIAGEIEEKMIRESMAFIDSMEQADRFVEYRNMYGVLTKAIPKIEYSGDKMQIDPDKTKRLKDLSKEFSSDEMQEYIAGILAGEYNQPGSYSLQTMAVIKNLSRTDMELLQKFTGICISGGMIPKSITEKEWRDFREQNGFNYTDFLRLQELGLMASKESGFRIEEKEEEEKEENGYFAFTVGEKKLLVKCKGEKVINIFTLTRAGVELSGLVKSETPATYYERLKKDLENIGFEVKYV